MLLRQVLMHQKQKNARRFRFNTNWETMSVNVVPMDLVQHSVVLAKPVMVVKIVASSIRFQMLLRQLLLKSVLPLARMIINYLQFQVLHQSQQLLHWEQIHIVVQTPSPR
eukprot:NODE_240_length_13260_cov_0.403313.p6 type:complete len:110 gc:universal NODE_240_length_13260_cov_0.403313:9822-9493(-)